MVSGRGGPPRAAEWVPFGTLGGRALLAGAGAAGAVLAGAEGWQGTAVPVTDTATSGGSPSVGKAVGCRRRRGAGRGDGPPPHRRKGCPDSADALNKLLLLFSDEKP